MRTLDDALPQFDVNEVHSISLACEPDEAVRRALDDEHRWESIESAIGSIPDAGHDWDQDAAGWVRRQRQDDARGHRP